MTKKLRDVIRTFLAAVMICAVPCQLLADDDFGRGNIPDNHYLSWGNKSVMIYGQSGANGGSNYFRVQTNNADQIQVNGTGLSVGTNNSLNRLDVNGGVAVGTYAGANAAPSNGVMISGTVLLSTTVATANGIVNNNVGLVISPQTISSTGVVVNSSGTADMMEFNVLGSTLNNVRVTANGQFRLNAYTMAQVESLTPDYPGALIEVTNYGGGTGTTFGKYVVCVATGILADQWQVISSTGGAGQNGCGRDR